MTEPRLRELRAALCVLETGSFRNAARRLGMAPSSVSHTISDLEATLGIRLFHRSTRSLALTPAGEEFLERVRPIITQLDAVLADPKADRGEVRGPLRINTSFTAGVRLIETIVPAFTERYPRIDLELVHEERLVDIVAQGCDAGIRLGRTVPGDMIGVPFGPELKWAAVAAPHYLERFGEPKHPSDLMKHRCLRLRMPSGERYAWEFERHDEEVVLDVPGSLTLDRMFLSIEAATKGLGIAYVLEQAVADRIASGSLRPVLLDWMPMESRYLLYYPGRRNVPPQLRAFIDFLRSKTI